MLGVWDRTDGEFIKKGRSEIAGKPAMDCDNVVPFPIYDRADRPKLGSFYAVVLMVIATWLMIGAIASAIFLMM
jgi:hypothetical protein